MRRSAPYDLAVQAVLAGALLAPLVCAFQGAGSFEEVYGAHAGSGLSGYMLVVSDAFGRSLAVGALASLLALALGLPAGWALSSRSGSMLPWALAALPLALAPSVAVSGWLYWMAPDTVASAFRLLPPGMAGPGPLFSLPGVALILGFSLWPAIAFESAPAFRRLRGEGYAAAVLAGTPARAFFRIVLPQARREVLAGTLLVFLLAASDFTVASLLLVRTLPVEVHDHLAMARPSAAAWTALPLLGVFLMLAVGLRLTTGRAGAWSADAPAASAVSNRASRGAWAVLGLGIAGGFVLPLAGCFAGAVFGKEAVFHALESGWPAFSVSARLALGAALLAMLAGALRIVCWPEQGARPLNAAALLLLTVPGAFLAAGLMHMDQSRAVEFERWGEAGAALNAAWPASFVLALGYVLRFAYLPLRLAEEGLRGLDPALLETAALAGHGRFARGLNVALPLLWRHLGAAGALVYVLALGELPVSNPLAPPGATPLSVWLFAQQHYGYTESVFALSLLAGLAAVAVVGVAFGLARGGSWVRRRADGWSEQRGAA